MSWLDKVRAFSIPFASFIRVIKFTDAVAADPFRTFVFILTVADEVFTTGVVMKVPY